MALAIALGILVLGAVAIGVLLIMVQHAGPARWISARPVGRSSATQTSTQVLRDISLLGGTYVMIAVALPWRRSRSTDYLRTKAVIGFLLVVVLGRCW